MGEDGCKAVVFVETGKCASGELQCLSASGLKILPEYTYLESFI